MLRHQLIVLRRRVRGRAQPTNNDRWFLVQMYRWFPSILTVVTIVQPETLVRWHRAGFRRYWRWKSNSRGGRPPIENELCALIRQMSLENQLWGAPRIHGELLKLGFRSLSRALPKYVVRRRGPANQGWRTLWITTRQHCRHGFVGVPDHRIQTSVWLRGCTDRSQGPLDQRHNQSDGGVDRASVHRGISLDDAPGYLIRDRDRIYGAIVTRRLRAMGIRDKPIAPASLGRTALPNG